MNIEKTLKNLEKNFFNTYFAETEKDILDFLCKAIPKEETIGVGGSQTLIELNLLEDLSEKGYKVNAPSTTGRDWATLTDENRYVNYYLMSSNAITENGELINTDGTGNRVANLLFGVKNVFVIAGTNKIVENIEKGIERVRNVATPPNCVRLGKNTPCVKTGKCEHCNSRETICKSTVISHHPNTKTNVTVILIDKKLGY